jgi:hypothetical protein
MIQYFDVTVTSAHPGCYSLVLELNYMLSCEIYITFNTNTIREVPVSSLRCCTVHLFYFIIQGHFVI